jgi:leucyl-tRNA synthetase
MERMRFNTALATLMVQLNYIARLTPGELGRFTIESYILMLAPMAPHLGEELWRELGHSTSIHRETWPKFDPEWTRDEMVTIPVQVNGKVRDRLTVEAGRSKEANIELALTRSAVNRHLDGKPPKDFIYVADKLLNIVA